MKKRNFCMKLAVVGLSLLPTCALAVGTSEAESSDKHLAMTPAKRHELSKKIWEEKSEKIGKIVTAWQQSTEKARKEWMTSLTALLGPEAQSKVDELGSAISKAQTPAEREKAVAAYNAAVRSRQRDIQLTWDRYNQEIQDDRQLYPPLIEKEEEGFRTQLTHLSRME